MNPSRRVVQLPRGSVSYLEWQSEAAPGSPTVVLLHGGGVDNASLSWGGIGPALAAAGHRVVAPDHPGYGESPSPSWQETQANLVSYVGEFVDALGLDEYVVGGLSLGGGLTIGHVLDRAGDQRLRGAMLFGSYGIMPRLSDGPFSLPMQVVTWAMLRTGLITAIMRFYARDPKRLAGSVETIIRNPEARTPELLAEVAATGDRGLDAFRQFQDSDVRWNRLVTDYTESLSSIRIPVLIVHGDHDTGVPVARAVRAAELIPHARLVVVPDAGHWVQRDRPDTVIPAVRAFLDGLDRKA